MTDKKSKRIIVMPPKSTSKVRTLEGIENTDLLLNDAKMIIAKELAHYRDKTARGSNLDLKEARVIQGYLDSLTKLQKEEREQSRAEDLSNLSDAELLALAQQLFKGPRPSLESKSAPELSKPSSDNPEGEC